MYHLSEPIYNSKDGIKNVGRWKISVVKLGVVNDHQGLQDNYFEKVNCHPSELIIILIRPLKP